MKKKLLAIFLTIVMVLTFAIPAMAANGIELLDEDINPIGPAAYSIGLPTPQGGVSNLTAGAPAYSNGAASFLITVTYGGGNAGSGTLNWTGEAGELAHTPLVTTTSGNPRTTTSTFTVRQVCLAQTITFTVEHTNNQGTTNRSIDVTIAGLGHTEDDGVEKTAPTCTDEGVMTYSCTRCGIETRTEAIEANGHEYISVVTAPTCEDRGFTTCTCSVCQDSFEHEYVDALGHKYVAAVTAPTCVDRGFTTNTCPICNDVFISDYVEAAGHKYDAEETAPTCVDRGFTTYTCSVCGDFYVDDFVNALGHDYVAVVTPMTPYQDGFTTNTCSRCEDFYISDRVERVAYDWQVVEIIDPTCTDRGYTVYRDDYWDAEKEDDYTDALDHDYTAVVTAPNCTEKGFTTHTCSRCGDEYADSYVDTNGHTAGGRIVIKEATRTEKGAWEIRCTDCGELLESGSIDELVIIGVTNAKFSSIRETAKNSRVWALTFTVTVTFEGGSTEVVEYTILLNGNNANLDGKYTFGADYDIAGMTLTYDIKGNGSNIKAFSIK